jgi:hypothetical protein
MSSLLMAQAALSTVGRDASMLACTRRATSGSFVCRAAEGRPPDASATPLMAVKVSSSTHAVSV